MNSGLKNIASSERRGFGRPGLLRAWGCLLVLLALGSFQRAEAAVGSWKFMVFGDTRGDDPATPVNVTVLGELARATLRERPAFVLVAGDLVYSGDPAAFQAWTNVMAPVYDAGIRVYPVIGNHDVADVDAFIGAFGASLPTNGPANETSRTYAINYSNALVLALDTYVIPDQVNQEWVDAVLATNTRPHVFALGHVPAFKVSHSDCLAEYPPARDAFWQSLGNAHCHIYFAGHDHFYDHTRLDDGDGNPFNDVHQIIVGTGGAPLYADGAYDGDNGLWTPLRQWHEEQYGYVIVEIDDDRVQATWRHRTGEDSYEATPEVLVFAGRPVLTCNYTSAHLTLTWTNGILQSAAGAMGAYEDVTNALSPYTVTNFVEPQQFFRLRGN